MQQDMRCHSNFMSILRVTAPDTMYTDACVLCNIDRTARGDLLNFHVGHGHGRQTMMENIESPVGHLPPLHDASSIMRWALIVLKQVCTLGCSRLRVQCKALSKHVPGLTCGGVRTMASETVAVSSPTVPQSDLVIASNVFDIIVFFLMV